MQGRSALGNVYGLTLEHRLSGFRQAAGAHQADESFKRFRRPSISGAIEKDAVMMNTKGLETIGVCVEEVFYPNCSEFLRVLSKRFACFVDRRIHARLLRAKFAARSARFRMPFQLRSSIIEAGAIQEPPTQATLGSARYSSALASVMPARRTKPDLGKHCANGLQETDAARAFRREELLPPIIPFRSGASPR